LTYLFLLSPLSLFSSSHGFLFCSSVSLYICHHPFFFLSFFFEKLLGKLSYFLPLSQAQASSSFHSFLSVSHQIDPSTLLLLLLLLLLFA